MVRHSKVHEATLEHRPLTGGPVLRSQQANVFQWPASEDRPLPEGVRHVRRRTNTWPHGFREFMRDRGRVERLRGPYENFIGLVVGPNPNTLDL